MDRCLSPPGKFLCAPRRSCNDNVRVITIYGLRNTATTSWHLPSLTHSLGCCGKSIPTREQLLSSKSVLTEIIEIVQCINVAPWDDWINKGEIGGYSLLVIFTIATQNKYSFFYLKMSYKVLKFFHAKFVSFNFLPNIWQQRGAYLKIHLRYP
jgi:hypothetical protein